MSYDPEQHGAECALCPLRGTPVVPPSSNSNATAILVGESPGKTEVEEKRPFCGPAGIELNRGLKTVGVPRNTLHVTNVLLCRPPEDNLAKLEKQTAKRIKRGDTSVKSPTACCAPRLFKEIEDHACANVIALGATAFKTIASSESSITAVRGGPRDVVIGSTLKHLMPTLHPAFVLRARRWTRAFHADLARAFRWFSTGLRWEDPHTVIAPRPAELRAWLDRHRNDPYLVCDLETWPGFPQHGHFDSLYDRITVVGIGTADGREALVVPVRSREPGAIEALYSAPERQEVAQILATAFADPTLRWAGHNFGYYDRSVIESRFGITMFTSRIVDMIGLHKMVEPELPHRLGYIGSIYTDAPSWKEDHTATDYKSDSELWGYNAKDLSITALSLQHVARAVKERDQTRAAKFWPKVQETAVWLHKAGMRVDQKRRSEYDKALLERAIKLRKEIRERVGVSSFNPNSTNQLIDLLYERWGLLPSYYTDLGDPGTGDDALRSFIMNDAIPPEYRATIKALRHYRVAVKLRGTYVTKLSPINVPIEMPELAWDDDESPEEREARKKRDAKKYGICLPDGRIHPDYSAHGTVGWRYSSSRPNAQNFPDTLRDMIIPQEGCVLVGCDEAQLELRMVAGLAKAAMYCAAFQRGDDPHKDLCLAVFGDTFKNANPKGQKALRRLVKEFTYAALYRAGPKTIWEVLTSSEDRETKELIFPDLTQGETVAMYETWLGRNPEIVEWWESDLREFQSQGFLAEPIFGLKRDFLDGEEINEIANYKAQSGGSALVHIATERVKEQIPFARWGHGTGLVNQGHDALVVECPVNAAERVKQILEESMSEDGNKYGLPLPFIGEGKIGKTWRDV